MFGAKGTFLTPETLRANATPPPRLTQRKKRENKDVNHQSITNAEHLYKPTVTREPRKTREKTGERTLSEEELAILSHYVQNRGTQFERPFQARVKNLLETSQSNGEHTLISTSLLPSKSSVPFHAPRSPKFTFIDLFAGIGGFRIALQELGGKCVFSSEWDKQAQKTYFLNYGEYPFGDITQEETKAFIPEEFDLLCAGFPCQSFSLAGRKLGFSETRGTLFFDVAEIIAKKQPRAFFLENVKGLVCHDKGRTLQTILKVLREDLNYYVPEPQLLNAKDFSLPQQRERIYIVGFRKDQGVTDFCYPSPLNISKTFADIREEKVVSAKYYLSTQYLKTLIEHKERHASKGNGFGYQIIPDTGIANAIIVGGMGRERNLVIDKRIEDFTPVTRIKGEINKEGIRRMTPREWARLQGFPEQFIIDVADTSAYKQFGNSVAIPVIRATAQEILKKLNSL